MEYLWRNWGHGTLCPPPNSQTIGQPALRRYHAIMASNTSKARAAQPGEEGPVIDMAELGARITRRRTELGEVEMPRNAGTRRTESKRALLKAIEDAGGKW